MRSTANSTTMFIAESHVDEIARGLGMDPLEFRILDASAGNARQSGAVAVLETLRHETNWANPERQLASTGLDASDVPVACVR